jgi:hypothetical protein
MPKLLVGYADGRYSTRLLTDAEADGYEAQGGDVLYLDDRMYAAYQHACDQDAMWQVFFRAISNEQSLRRRERELMPLEEAQRKIAELEEKLARHERMENHWREAYASKQTAAHREEYVEYTCIYPQPGCNLDALKAVAGVHPEWIEAAEEIVEQPRFSERAAEGLKYQGCCCGHKHLKLDDAEATKLRAAGFIVENDSQLV